MECGGEFLAGSWVRGEGEILRRQSPVDGTVTYEVPAASVGQIEAAVTAARRAQTGWSRTGLDRRIQSLERFARELENLRPQLALAISRETGKPLWESQSEVDAMIRKAPLTIEAHRTRRAETESSHGPELAATRYKPHGVAAVFGPFNFPGHLPNGHIMPALLAGNTIVFKPSELSPLVAELTVKAWEAAGLPAGVLNLVQGGPDVGRALSGHPGIDGIFFTGSFSVGEQLSRQWAAHPGKILALEMGGNNPLIAWSVPDPRAAAYHIIVSAYITAGQRCSCARRLILPNGSEGERILASLIDAIGKIRVGRHDADPPPFMGSLISAAAAERVLAAQTRLIRSGGVPLVQSHLVGNNQAMLSPGLIDVTQVTDRPDTEIFGPLLQVIRVADFDAAIEEANATAYGLCAGLLSDDRQLYEKFFAGARAGLINWNRPTTGASSTLPFGGIGCSGNHRPSGSWAVDYCSYPVASLEASELKVPEKRMPGL